MNTFPLSRPLTLDEFVKGYADGGEVESIMPTEDDNFLSTLPADVLMDLADRYDVAPPESRVTTGQSAPGTMGSMFVPGLTTSLNLDALSQYNAPLTSEAMARLSLMDLSGLQGLAATSFADPNIAATAQYRKDTRAGIGSGGSLYEEGAIEAAKASADPTTGLWQEGFKQLLAQDPEGTQAAIEAAKARNLGALAKVEEEYGVMKPLSDMLKANQFKEAFDFAKEKGVVDKLMNTDVLRELRPAFSQQEMRDFFAAVPPDYAGGKFEFKPDIGVLESMDPYGHGTLMESGYPDPTRAFKRKDDKTVENLAKIAAVAMITAGVAPLFSGAGAASGAGAGAGAGAAGGASAAGATTAAAGAAGAGAAAAPLAEVVVTAKKISDLAKLAQVAGGVGGLGAASKALTAAPSAPAQPAPTQAATQPAPTQPAPTQPLPDDLAEVVVQASKRGAGSLLGPTTLASTSLMTPGSMSDISTDIYGNVEPAPETTPETTEPVQEEPFADRLDEVVVTGKRAIDPALLRLVPGSLASANLIQGMTDIPTDIYGQVEGQPDLTEGKIEATEAQQPQEPFKDRLDEVIVTGSKYKPGLLDLAKIGTGGLTAAELFKGYTEPTLRPYEELPPEGEPMEEVIVTGSKPPPIDLVKIGVGGLTAAQLMQGFTQPKVDPLTGEPTEPPKTEQELDKIQDALKTGAPIPGTSNRFLDLLKKYGTIENILKVAGAVSGLGSTKAPPTGSGAGAVYDPRTSAGAGAWIDWEKVKAEADAAGMNLNTYTARNWNKIQNRALEAGTQQAVAPVVPQGYNFPGVGGENMMVSPEAAQPNFDLLKYLEEYQPQPMAKGSKVQGPGHGREDLIPALLSDGEYVIDAETMALLGNGSTDAGAKMMDGFRENIRKHKGAKLAKGGISPNAKSPLQYLRGA